VTFPAPLPVLRLILGFFVTEWALQKGFPGETSDGSVEFVADL